MIKGLHATVALFSKTAFIMPYLDKEGPHPSEPQYMRLLNSPFKTRNDEYIFLVILSHDIKIT